ncbi:hypothetical protein BLAT2472_80336 [Burkholderia latens]
MRHRAARTEGQHSKGYVTLHLGTLSESAGARGALHLAFRATD